MYRFRISNSMLPYYCLSRDDFEEKYVDTVYQLQYIRNRCYIVYRSNKPICVVRVRS